MRQLNSLGQAVAVETSSTAVTFKNLKNDQQKQQQPKKSKQSVKKKTDKYQEKAVSEVQNFEERRSGDERRTGGKAERQRWIESRQQPDRRKSNQQTKVNFVI